MYGAIHKTLSVDEEQSATLINSVGNEQVGGRILYDSNAPIGYGTRSSEKRRMLIGFFIFIGITLVCIGAIDLFGSSSSTSSSSSSSSSLSYDTLVRADNNETIYITDTSLMYIEASNEYGVFDKSYYSYFDDVQGTQLMEPYKDTTFTISGSHLENDYYYFWKLPGVTKEEGTGTEWVVSGQKPGNYDLTVKVYDSTGAYVGEYYTVVVLKYVKRELRTLTVADREAFLDAAAEIWNYDTTSGREIYGSQFTSIQTFVAEHSLASNDIRCDSFHEGSGFLTHHLALQNSFEAALRAVDPSVTLPYWDFTIEGQQILDEGQNPSYLLEISDVFTDTWFGSVDDDDHIADSRWAHSQMPVQEDSSSGTKNSYGYIRSYWNNNPDDEVARHLFDACGVEPVHKAIPYCGLHYDVLNVANLAGLQLLTPSDGHGPMHVQIGGVWGGCTEAYANFTAKWADELDASITVDDINDYYPDGKSWKWGYDAPRRLQLEKAVMGEYFHIYRSFWRSHMCAIDNTPALLVCPDECDLDVPFEDCSCQVDELVEGTTTWENLFPCVLNSESNQESFKAIWSDEMLEDLVYFLATSSVLEGEMIESASTADIMFWLIHPAIERLVFAKRLPLVTDMGGTEFYKWDIVDGSNETWLSYSYYSLEEGENLYYPDAYTCEGHAADDNVLPAALPLVSSLKVLADTDNNGKVTNWEYFVAINPNNMDGIDYVFDNYKWDHCDGVDMDRR